MATTRPPRMLMCMQCNTQYPDTDEVCPQCGKTFMMSGDVSAAGSTETQSLQTSEPVAVTVVGGLLHTALVFSPVIAAIVFLAIGWTWTGIGLLVFSALIYGGVEAFGD